MAAGNVPLIDAQALTFLEDNELNEMHCMVVRELNRRSDISSATHNLGILNVFLTESSAFDCEEAKRKIRTRLDSREDARWEDVYGGVARSVLHQRAGDVEFKGLTVSDGTVKWSDAKMTYFHILHGNACYDLEMVVSYGAGQSTITGNGDVFGLDTTYTISVDENDSDDFLKVVKVNIAGRSATLETFLPVFNSSGGVLKAVRTFVSGPLGASEFIVGANVAVEQALDQARAFWLTGE